MKNVASLAQEFARLTRANKKPTIHVAKSHAEAFLGELARLGFDFAEKCLDEIDDPELRSIVKTLFFCTAAAASTGAAIGSWVGGPAGAQVGAVIGAGIGVVIGCAAYVIKARQVQGPNGPELVLSVQ